MRKLLFVSKTSPNTSMVCRVVSPYKIIKDYFYLFMPHTVPNNQTLHVCTIKYKYFSVKNVQLICKFKLVY